MKVKFIKTHVSGIKEGTERNLEISHARRLKKEGYVEFLEEDEEGSADEGKNLIALNPFDLSAEELLTAGVLTVTKDDLKKNPAWKDLGIKAGQDIYIKPVSE